MVNFSTLVLTSEVNGPGGLFDFNATLPLVIIQFILLMLLLNITLYKPLLSFIYARDKYILAELDWASILLVNTNEVNLCYEKTLKLIRTRDQSKIINLQLKRKEKFDNQLESFQKRIDVKLTKILDDLYYKNQTTKDSVDDIANSLCSIIETRLFL